MANILRVADPLESAGQSVQLYAMQKEERKTTQVEKEANSSIDSLAGWGRDEKWASSDIDWDASASLPVKILVPASKLLPRKLQNPTAIRWYVFRITWGGGGGRTTRSEWTWSAARVVSKESAFNCLRHRSAHSRDIQLDGYENPLPKLESSLS